jgi:hypothetical protein
MYTNWTSLCWTNNRCNTKVSAASQQPSAPNAIECSKVSTVLYPLQAYVVLSTLPNYLGDRHERKHINILKTTGPTDIIIFEASHLLITNFDGFIIRKFCNFWTKVCTKQQISNEFWIYCIHFSQYCFCCIHFCILYFSLPYLFLCIP